jgi:hypothetical protein
MVDLSTYRNLLTIDFSFKYINDSELKILLEQNPNITHLTLYRNKITDGGIKHLADIKTLTFLSLSCSCITDEGLKFFSGNTS